MPLDDDIAITQLLNEVKQLFHGQAPTAAPAGKATMQPALKGYQAPIKGTWYNSGGFDPAGNIARPNGRKGHQGLDLRAQGGTPLYPIAPGVVTSVGTDQLGGNVVNVQHADGVRSYYAHMATAKVQKGQKVDYDTVLGTVGDTGNAKGTVFHCHFQVWKDNQIQDPANYFSVPPYSNVSAEEKAKGSWVSEEAKQEAANFNMKQHTQQRVALSDQADTLLKLSHQFYKLASR